MKEILKKSWKHFTILIIGIIVGILINIPSCHKQEGKIEYIPVHDTITVNSERIIEHTKIVKSTDTVVKVLCLSDTVTDSVYVSLPMEYKEYKDTLNTDTTNAIIDINYHGVYCSIDSISLNYNYYKERETIIKEPKRFGLDVVVGPYVGYGLNLTPTNPSQINHGFEFGIGVSIGIAYRITK